MAFPVTDKDQLLFSLNNSAHRFRDLGVKHLGFHGAFAPNTEKTSELIDYSVEFEEGKESDETRAELGRHLEEIACRTAKIHSPDAFKEKVGQDGVKQASYVDLTT